MPVIPIKKDYVPSVEDLALYVKSLKLCLDDNSVKDQDVAYAIESMPEPVKIKNSLSYEECKVVFESVRWAWKKITDQDLIELSSKTPAPKTLMGNYWMLSEGLLLRGVNHYTIIKQNLNLFSSILNINAFVLHEKLSGSPTEIIKLIIDKGGVRVFVSDDKKAYFQMNDKEYGKWGKKKVKHLDFKEKVVKLIATNTPYNGWKSGFTIIL